MASPPAPSQQFNWQYYLARSGPEGEQWLKEFHQPEHAVVAGKINGALGFLHRRDPEPARQSLEEVDTVLRELAGERASIRHVLGRIYHGVLSYYFYFMHRFEEAGEELEVARECVRQALHGDPILLPMALDCLEFHLHHARIARNQQLWNEMRRQIGIADDMVENRSPLCVLPDGTAVDYQALARYFGALTLEPAAIDGLMPIVDPAARRESFERFVMAIYCLPGFVISSP